MSEHHAAGETILGRYTLEHVLGKGSFGTTWAARDTQSGRSVAIKALDLSRVDEWKAVELFEREAHVLEQLDHPRIPAYLDFVPVQSDETGYLVQSLAPGEPLDTVLARRGRFTDAEIEGVAERTLEILTYLGALNPAVVHRDIKPSNLIIDSSADVYLVDFGAVQDAAKRTSEGGSTVAGTFGYMAPEQLHGAASPQADLYALGMTLLHLASGKHPSKLPRRGLDVDFRAEVDLPAALTDFIGRLVAPNPDDRWESAAAALAHLRHEVPLSPNLSQLPSGGSSVADTVLARERAAENAARAAERARQRAIERRKVAVTKRRDRASVAMNADELLISFRPIRWTVGLAAGGIASFLFINPGFAVAGGFPFFGPTWPFFADFWPGRWLVWGAFVFLMWLFAVWYATPPRRLKLSKEGFFAAYNRNPNKPSEAGRFAHFSVEVLSEEPGFPGETVKLTLTDNADNVVYQHSFGKMSAADIELLNTLPHDWNEPDRARITLDHQPSEEAETEEVAEQAHTRS